MPLPPMPRQGRRVDSMVEFLDFLCPSARTSIWRMETRIFLANRTLSQYILAVEYHIEYHLVLFEQKNPCGGSLDFFADQ